MYHVQKKASLRRCFFYQKSGLTIPSKSSTFASSFRKKANKHTAKQIVELSERKRIRKSKQKELLKKALSCPTMQKAKDRTRTGLKIFMINYGHGL